MLKLFNISKDYIVGNTTISALKNINLCFRDSEFVSILGASGCGKTTLLNIVGGLDKFSTGDLIINGTSTKKFKSKDWDAYRNHSIGFVFQSYNLIGHLTILKNVELALTLSGVSGKERKIRATAALQSVGLEEQVNKKPNQLSGGQMQRVAIARALVNNPAILLADEPTGALDSKTSVQIMDILKSISSDRLIIMVTHNPEIAEEYSTRIVRLSDGEVVDDNDPFEIVEEPKEDILPSFVGETCKNKGVEPAFVEVKEAKIANATEEICAEAVTEAAAESLAEQPQEQLQEQPNVGEEEVKEVASAVEKMSPNNALKTLFEKIVAEISEKINENKIAEKNKKEKNELLAREKSELLAKEKAMKAQKNTKNEDEISKKGAASLDENAKNENLMTGVIAAEKTDTAAVLPQNKVKKHKIVKEKKTRAQKTSMSYFTALTLSLRNLMTKKGRTMITAIAGSIGILGIALVLSISNGFGQYIAKMETDIMTNQPVSIQQTTIDLEEMQNAMIDSSLTEKDMFPSDGKIRPYKSGGLDEIASYTNNLSPKFIEHMKKLNSSLYRSIDVMKNINFHALTKYDDGTFAPMEISANGSIAGIMSMFTGGGNKVSFNQMVNNKDYVLEHYELLKGNYPEKDNDVVLVLDSYNRVSTDVLGVLGYKNIENGVTLDFDEILQTRNRIQILNNNQNYYKDGALYSAISAKITTPEEFKKLYEEAFLNLNISGIMRIRPQDTSTMLATGICFNEGITTKILEDAKNSDIVIAQLTRLGLESMRNVPITSILTGEELGLTNMSDLTAMNFSVAPIGNISIPGLSEVSAINIYASDLNAKEKIVSHINDWNSKQLGEANKIKYTDAMSFMFGSFEIILSAITYILIAFVAISLVVSTVMIGIITYVSVIERTKEIGILRSIGARKKDISRVFNAESISVGFTSGLLGIFVAWLLLFPINMVLKHFTQIANLAILNPLHALILLAISMFLTFISGLIPSKIAANKDPITALRTE